MRQACTRVDQWLNKIYVRLHVTFIDKDGQTHKFEVAEGDNLLDIAQANDLEMEGLSKLQACCYSL